jgi:hypothetical protein
MVAEQYNRMVYDLTGWRGAFPLIIPIRVGDYFELRDDGAPVKLGNVFDWPGWTPAAVPVESEAIEGSETYYSGCQRKTGIQGGAGVQAPGGVGIEGTLSLSFSKGAGFVLAYDAATRSRIRDLAPVRNSILSAARSGLWQQNWILVVEVIAAESATLAVATEKNSELDLHANAAIPADAIAGVAIAKPTLGWTASSWKGNGYTSLCQPGTPLYHCLKLRKSRFRDWQSELLGDSDPADLFTDDPLDAS